MTITTNEAFRNMRDTFTPEQMEKVFSDLTTGTVTMPGVKTGTIEKDGHVAMRTITLPTLLEQVVDENKTALIATCIWTSAPEFLTSQPGAQMGEFGIVTLASGAIVTPNGWMIKGAEMNGRVLGMLVEKSDRGLQAITPEVRAVAAKYAVQTLG